MIGGTYVLSGPIPFFGDIRVANAEDSSKLLREYAVQDMDADGLLDWQEALYSTDPRNPESFMAGKLDGDAVAEGLIQPKVVVADAPDETDLDSIPGADVTPNSVTERFGQTLLKQYLLSRGQTPPTTDEIATFVEDGVDSLSEQAVATAYYDESDVRSSGAAGREAMVQYLIAAEDVFGDNTVPSDKNELFYFSAAMRGDASALDKIQQISGAYNNIATALMRLPVPEEAETSHLAIANALMHMSDTTSDMGTVEEDPLRALLGIGLYEDYANETKAAFMGLNNVTDALQVAIPEGTPGSYMLRAARAAAAVQ